MKVFDRYNEYKKESFDRVLNNIIRGKIKCGKYSNLIKVKEKDYEQLKRESK